MKNSPLYLLGLLVVVVVLVPAGPAEAQCERCKWCGIPFQTWLEECDGPDGYPHCSDLGCLSWICTHGPWGEECDGWEVDLGKINRDRKLAEQQGASIEKHVIAGTLIVYTGTLSASIPASGGAEAVEAYFDYRTWNSCAEKERRRAEAAVSEASGLWR